jgi:hypothetical protein
MTKAERRKARQAARAAGKPLTGQLALGDRERGPVEFTDTSKGRKALDRWARRYYNQAGPDSPDDY